MAFAGGAIWMLAVVFTMALCKASSTADRHSEQWLERWRREEGR
jgi:hypothetical protein